MWSCNANTEKSQNVFPYLGYLILLIDWLTAQQTHLQVDGLAGCSTFFKAFLLQDLNESYVFCLELDWDGLLHVAVKKDCLNYVNLKA